MPQSHYTQLSHDERVVIENRLRSGDSMREIAKSINRNPSTISRELRRNGLAPDCKTTRVNKPREDGRHSRGRNNDKLQQRKLRYRQRYYFFKQHSVYRYKAKRADWQSYQRKTLAMKKSHPLKLIRPENKDLLIYIEEKLELRWSPEQIDLRLKLEKGKQIVSYNSIYRYIYFLKPDLKKHLRRRGLLSKRRRTHTVYNQTDRLNHSIHNRPKIVDKLLRFGDLEGDTIVGKDNKDRIVTHVDRVSGVLSMGLVLGYDAKKVSKQTILDIKRVFGKIRTITYDNGIEFTLWRETQKMTKSTIYFADAYTPRQRGRNENANGLIRDFLPKGTDFSKLTQADIMKIESLINNRPRKRFGGMTPIEARVALEL